MIQEDKIKMNDTSQCVCKLSTKKKLKFCIYCAPEKYCEHLRFKHTCTICVGDEKLRIWLNEIRKKYIY